MAITETCRTGFGEQVVVLRSNTYTEGYFPIVRELEGLISLIKSLDNLLSYACDPTTNERSGIIGNAQLLDAWINLGVSPITGAITVLFLNHIFNPPTFVSSNLLYIRV